MSSILKEKWDQFAEDVKDDAEKAKDKVESGFDKMKKDVDDGADKAKDKMEDAKKDIEEKFDK